MIEPVVLTCAYLLDLVIGDPRWLPHPVRFIGWGIERMEGILRNKEHRAKNTDHRQKMAGVFLVSVIVGVVYGLFYFLNSTLLNSGLPGAISYVAVFLLVYFTSTTIATRDLLLSGRRVLDTVRAGDRVEASRKLSMIVGRDTQAMDARSILRATIETISENASDGIIAPLFYFAIGGLPLAMAYKAVNTLDSMVGYKNEKYKDFGWAAARLDDIANYVPARITGVLIFTSTFILSAIERCRDALKISSSRSNGLNSLNSLSIMLRDGRNHSSPNSGFPEAAMAGALGVRLGGPSTYGGVLVEKPFIGEEIQNTEHGRQSADERHRQEQGESSADKEMQGSEERYYVAAERSFFVVGLTSFLGFSGALVLLYMRSAR